MAQGFGWYLDTIGRVPLLTPAEEIELGTAIRRWLDWPGGPDHAPPAVARRGRRAKERFIAANLRLPVHFVQEKCQRLVRQGELEDVVQAANLGLMRAVEMFDPARGYKFSTYAYWWIRQTVNRHSDTQCRLIKIPGLHNQLIAKLVKTARDFQAFHRRQPTIDELAECSGLPARRVEQLLEEKLQLVSLDMGLGDEAGLTLGDLMATPPPAEPDDSPELLQLRERLTQLPPLQQQVITLRYGFDGPPLGPKQTASALGLRLGDVQQLERQALEQLGQGQQEPRTDHPQPERFAHCVGAQLALDLPSPPVVLVTGRRQAGLCGRQRKLHLQRRDAAESAVDQLTMCVPVMQQPIGEILEIAEAG